MHYGHPPHVHSTDDLTMLRCDHETSQRPCGCGWLGPYTRTEMQARGLPWYCDSCGERISHFITYHPSEWGTAKRIMEA